MAQVQNAAVVVDSNGSKSIGRGNLLATHLRAWADEIENGEIIVHGVHVHIHGTLLDGVKKLTLEVDSVESVHLEED